MAAPFSARARLRSTAVAVNSWQTGTTLPWHDDDPGSRARTPHSVEDYTQEDNECSSQCKHPRSLAYAERHPDGIEDWFQRANQGRLDGRNVLEGRREQQEGDADLEDTQERHDQPVRDRGRGAQQHRHGQHVAAAIDDTVLDPAQRIVLRVDTAKAALYGIPVTEVARVARLALAGEDITPIHDGQSKYTVPVRVGLSSSARGSLDAMLKLKVRGQDEKGQTYEVALAELVVPQTLARERVIHRKDLQPVVYVMADVAGGHGKTDSPLYGVFATREALSKIQAPGGLGVEEHWISAPSDRFSTFSLKWDGEWQITYETFRDMGLAYGVGLILIYLLVVAHFKSYLTPLIIMAPIPLTIIGVMPGHALLRSQFTATSMIGMIALAGIIVRNSILLVDFIKEETTKGMPFKEAIVSAAAVRAKPIALTALAAMLGALFILDDPIFNGLAISLIFGILVSTLLTLVVIPVLYYAAFKKEHTS